MTNKPSSFDLLKKSVTFNMSLGSKELFHSNFLYWISQTNQDFFLDIMRDLAGHPNIHFWWEESNFEVKREYHNFDLCICVKYENNSKKADREDYILMPVLILENKMKSLPQTDQLKQYTKKALDLNKKARNKLAIDEKTANGNDQASITFILLSLLGLAIDTKFRLDNKDYFWEKKNYENLYNAFKASEYKEQLKGLALDIVNDYMKFIDSLSNLAKNDWSFKSNDSFNQKLILPNKVSEELRIHDIRDKINFQLLLKLIQEELVHNYPNFKIFYGTYYSNQKALIDIWWEYGNVNLKIQLQGNVYKHAIEVPDKKTQNLDNYCKNENINDDMINSFLNFTEGNEIFKNLVVEEKDGSIKIMPKDNKQAGHKDYSNKYCYYGKTFAYKYMTISSCENISIENVVKMIVKDVYKYYKK
jgi:hypothetical protein